MKKILVLRGGLSSEKEISLRSGEGVLRALKQKKYQVMDYVLTDNVGDFIRVLSTNKPDVVFNALHGKFGEDGCVQGILNMMQIPYTHSGVVASAVGMDKELTRRIVAGAGVRVAKGFLVSKSEFENGKELSFPYVLKPNNEGSSVGVWLIKNKKDRQQVLNHWSEQDVLLTEKYIDGRELSVAVLENRAVGVVEIIPKSGYYDYHNKYTSGATQHVIPAKIPPDIYQEALEMAERAHQAIGCRGVSRSDFRLDVKGKLFFLEINTNPGMTELSLVPELVRVCDNMSYVDLVERLVENAQCDK